MIIDKLSNAALYSNLHPRLKKGFDFLQDNDLAALGTGTYQIEDDKVFVMIQEYDTKRPEQCFYEAHYQYTDIQYMIRGEEKMGYTNVANKKVKKADKEKDFIELTEVSGDLFLVTEGSFAVFTPQDAHMPGHCVDQPRPIKKAVVKVLMD